MSETEFQFFPAERNCGFRMDGYYIWCGSVIRDRNGTYHMFASRWKRGFTFHPGWLTDSEIVRAVSNHPEGPFTFAEVVLPRRGQEFWDGCMTHNPRIVSCGSKYLLFYTGTTYPFPFRAENDGMDGTSPMTIVARANKRIGIAVADSPAGPWTRFNAPVLPTKPETFYSFLTSNPSPVVNPDGSIYLMFKSRAYEKWKHSSMFIGAAVADSWDAPFRIVSKEPLFGTNQIGEIEDPFVWRENGEFRLIAKSMRGMNGVAPSDGIFANSPDGIVWTFQGPAYRRKISWTNGMEESFALLERPSLLFENDRPSIFYAACATSHPYTDPTSDTWNIARKIR